MKTATQKVFGFPWVQKFVGPLGEGYELAGPGGSIKTDDGRMSATCVVAATNKDRQGEIVECSGVRFGNHQRNPVAMLDHGRVYPLPIGKNESPDGEYTVWYDPDLDEIRAETFFTQRTQMGNDVYWLVKEKILGANSIGFIPEQRVPLGWKKPDGNPAMHVLTCDYLETTWTALPVNAEAVQRCLRDNEICGKSMLPEMREALKHLEMPRKVWSRGKAMQPMQPEASGIDPNSMENPTEPHGASLMRKAYAHCKSLTEAHEAMMPEFDDDMARCDHDGVKKIVGKCMKALNPHIDGHMATMEEGFEKHYPELPPLAPEGEGKSQVQPDDAEEELEDESQENDADAAPVEEDVEAAEADAEVPEEEDEDEHAEAGKKSMAAAMPQASLGETGGAPLVPPPGHMGAMTKAADWLGDLGHENKHPNLDAGQKSACMHHAAQLRGMGGPAEMVGKALTPLEQAEKDAEEALATAILEEAAAERKLTARMIKIAERKKRMARV